MTTAHEILPGVVENPSLRLTCFWHLMLGSLPASATAGLPYWEGTMTTKFIISVLLVSALATPASAGNWFHNPHLNINRNIGSAPNPTPADIREMRLPVVTQAETPV